MTELLTWLYETILTESIALVLAALFGWVLIRFSGGDYIPLVVFCLTVLFCWLFLRAQRHRARRRLLGLLAEAPQQGHMAWCVRIGGRGEALPDVKRYLRQAAAPVDRVLCYRAPDGVDLADPEVALAIVEDLHDVVTDYGKGELSEIHLFYAGMVAYPFVLGGLLGNWAPVTVYHKPGNDYVPLYRFDRSRLHQGRTTSPLAQLELQPVEPAADEPAKNGDAPAAG